MCENVCFVVQNGIQEHCQATPAIAQEVPISPDLRLPPPPRLNDAQGPYSHQPSHPNQGPSGIENGVPMEVPVIIESRHSVFQSKGEKSSCSPFEIRYAFLMDDCFITA